MSSPAVAPKILGFIPEDISAWLLAGLAFAGGISLTSLLAFGTSELYQQQLHQRFELLAHERASRIEERFADQVQRLDSLRRFFLYSDEITRAEFNGFAGPLLLRTQVYTWAPLVSEAQRSALVQRARQQGVADYAIRDAGPASALVPAAAHVEYVPVFYSQAQASVQAPLGFNLLSQSDRRAAIERARSTGQMAVSAPINLVGVQGVDARGVMMAASVTGASGNVVGFVTAIISIRQLMTDGLPGAAEDNLVVRILDFSTPQQPEVLFRSPGVAAPSQLDSQRVLHLADRQYRLQIGPSDVFLQSNHSSVVNLVVLLGGLLSVLLSALLYSLASQRKRALALVEQRTGDLLTRERELRALSVTDALTGIHNRRYFQERLKTELERAQRDGLPLAVIMLDIDHFKAINDRFGHAAGDCVLQVLCQRISQRLRRTDVFCRLGGEEFILLCPDTDSQQAHSLASNLWQGVREARIEGVGVITASFGVAAWRPPEGADALLLRADSGVYAAKQAGRDRVEPELS